MARCSGIKRDGGRCGAQAIAGSAYCFNHHPDYAERRATRNRKGGKTGGRGRGRRELQDVKAHLLRLASDVEEGRMDPKTGAVVSQILNVYLRGVETERRLREAEELERRIEELEASLPHPGRGYGPS